MLDEQSDEVQAAAGGQAAVVTAAPAATSGPQAGPAPPGQEEGRPGDGAGGAPPGGGSGETQPHTVPELLDAMEPAELARVEGRRDAPRYDPETGEDLTPAIEQVQRALTDLGVPGHLVERVVRRGRERPTYELVLKPDGQVVTLGPSSRLLKPREVQARLLDATSHAMRTVKLDDWRAVAEKIVRAAEFSDEPSDDWRHRLREYLGQRLVQDRDGAAARSEPFADEAGRPHVHREKFGLFLRRHLALSVSAEDVREGLRALGFESVEVWWSRDDGRRARTLYWRGPADWDR